MGSSRLKQFTSNLKVEKGCSVCGYNKLSSALDFHHIIGEKHYTIGSMSWDGGFTLGGSLAGRYFSSLFSHFRHYRLFGGNLNRGEL